MTTAKDIPSPHRTLEDLNKVTDKATWGADEWVWNSQECIAIPKLMAQAQQQCTQTNTENDQNLNCASAPASAPNIGALSTISKIRGSADSQLSRPGCCQADGCKKNLSKLTFYHVRNKICDVHIKADSFYKDNVELRFCQRCGHPHDLSEFDGTKHSCRAQLEKHNVRRRKKQAELGASKAKSKTAAQGTRGCSKRSASKKQRDEDCEDIDFNEDEEALIVARSRRRRRKDTSEIEEKPETVTTEQQDNHAPLSDAVLTGSRVAEEEVAPPLPYIDFDIDGTADIFTEEELNAWVEANLGKVDDFVTDDIDKTQTAEETGSANSPRIEMATNSFDYGLDLVQPREGSNALAGTLPTTPQLSKNAIMSTICIKLFGCTPAELPNNLKEQLVSWFDGSNLDGLDTYLRPGCVHLTLQAILNTRKRQHPDTAGRELQPDRTLQGIRRFVDKMLASQHPIWHTKTLLVQSGPEVALIHNGKLQHVWNIVDAEHQRIAPAVLTVSPLVLLADKKEHTILLQGVNILQNNTEIVSRLQGQYVKIKNSGCGNCSCSASVKSCCRSDPLSEAQSPSSWESRCCGCCMSKLADLKILQEETSEQQQPVKSCCASKKKEVPVSNVAGITPQLVSITIDQSTPLSPGLLHIDVLKRAYMAPRGGTILVVDSPTVHAELTALAASSPADAAQWVVALGTVFEYVGNPNKVKYPAVEHTASILLHEAVEAGLIGIAQYLHELLQGHVIFTVANHRSSSVSSVLNGLDALALMGQVDQICRSITLKRASKLGSKDPRLSLLHLAVMSQNTGMVDMVRDWGREARMDWRCDMKGPRGLTPLHLAVFAQNPAKSAAMILKMLSLCPPGRVAWNSVASDDGQTPADFAFACKRLGLLLAFGQPSSRNQEMQLEMPATKLHLVQKVVQESIEDEAPATPRRCRCTGNCPCSMSAEPCASCISMSSDDQGCGGGDDGTCLCCAASN